MLNLWGHHTGTCTTMVVYSMYRKMNTLGWMYMNIRLKYNHHDGIHESEKWYCSGTGRIECEFSGGTGVRLV